jgi:hypothetical protein
VVVLVADGPAPSLGTGDAVTGVADALTEVGPTLGDSASRLGPLTEHPHAIETATAVTPAATAPRGRRSATTGIATAARLSHAP